MWYYLWLAYLEEVFRLLAEEEHEVIYVDFYYKRRIVKDEYYKRYYD